jgi:hypothetical protein
MILFRVFAESDYRCSHDGQRKITLGATMTDLHDFFGMEDEFSQDYPWPFSTSQPLSSILDGILQTLPRISSCDVRFGAG